MSYKRVRFRVCQLTKKARDGVNLISNGNLISPFILKLTNAVLQQTHFSEICSFATVIHPVLKEYVHMSKKCPTSHNRISQTKNGHSVNLPVQFTIQLNLKLKLPIANDTHKIHPSLFGDDFVNSATSCAP